MNLALIGTAGVAAGLALILTLELPGFTESAPNPAQQGPGATAEATAEIEWRTDLAAALAEARRTKRPLLAVFR